MIQGLRGHVIKCLRKKGTPQVPSISFLQPLLPLKHTQNTPTYKIVLYSDVSIIPLQSIGNNLSL